MKQIFYLILLVLEIYSFPTSENPKRELELSDDIVILHTNDVHCGTNDTLGYDGLMLYKKQLQKKYKYVITVDVGDHIQGGTIGLITSGEGIIDMMNKVGYDVAILGNHEFDYGVSQLEKCEEKLNCSYICVNYCYRKNKTAIYPGYKIIEAGSKKIAFIGVATPQTLTKTYLITVLDDDGTVVYDFLTENQSKELHDRVQQTIDICRNEEKADYVIILAHLGIGGDALEENTSAGLVKKIKNVDALLDGHTHLVYSQKTPDKNGKDIFLAQTGTKLTNIGKLTISSDGTFSHENIDAIPYDPDLDADTLNLTRSKKIIYVDKEMNGFIDEILGSFSDILGAVVGKTDFPLYIYNHSDGKEKYESSEQLSRFQENALCNLAADAIRYAGDADVTILNAGSVRVDLEQGDITYQEILNIMPFSNDILVKEVTGKTILDALEFGVRTLPDRTSRFPQVSGITYKVDLSIDSSVVVDSNESFLRVGGKRRVYDVKINGEKINLQKKYTLSGSIFILEGGDGYSMLAPNEVLKTSVGVDNDALLSYIRDYYNGVIPNKYQDVEGRIVKTQGEGRVLDDSSFIKRMNMLLVLLVLLLF